MAVANTVAYYDTPTITAVKSFIAQTPEKTSTCQLKTFFVFLFFGNIFFSRKRLLRVRLCLIFANFWGRLLTLLE
jgi:hypothetical protein